MVQGELFIEDSNQPKLNQKSKSFLSQHGVTLTLDKLLLLTIGLMVVFALTYSFGVERGKRLMERKLESMMPIFSETVLERSLPTASYPDQKDEVVLVVNQDKQEIAEAKATREVKKDSGKSIISEKQVLPVANQDKGKYTIQLVTYTNERQAGNEISRLESSGHNGFVIPSGRFYQVCSEYFKNRHQATNLLKNFRSSGRYPDAYIRPIVR